MEKLEGADVTERPVAGADVIGWPPSGANDTERLPTNDVTGGLVGADITGRTMGADVTERLVGAEVTEGAVGVVTAVSVEDHSGSNLTMGRGDV